MNRRTATLFIFAASLVFSGPLQAAGTPALQAETNAQTGIPAVGELAPSFDLPSQSGTLTSLSSLRGKWVVLYFYPEDMSTGCTIEAHNFQRDQEKFQALNAIIVGVSTDSVDSHKQFCAKEGLNIKLLSDTSKRMVTSYGSLHAGSSVAARNTFLIDPKGRIVKIWAPVSIPHHSEEVLAVLRSQTKE